jgi:hypothetical protein
MQYQDGHISTCFNKKVLVIYVYCTDACASQSLFMIYLFVLSYSLLIVHLFCSLFDYLFCFRSRQFFDCSLFKRKRTILILDCVPGISIPCYLFKYPLNRRSTCCTCSSIQHHHIESINIIQQTPPTLP